MMLYLCVTGSSASGSSRKEKGDKSGKKSSSPAGSGSDTDTVASARRGPASENIPPGTLGVPPDVGGSRQSFRMAMGNPCEFFVDVMWSLIMAPLQPIRIVVTWWTTNGGCFYSHWQAWFSMTIKENERKQKKTVKKVNGCTKGRPPLIIYLLSTWVLAYREEQLCFKSQNGIERLNGLPF